MLTEPSWNRNKAKQAQINRIIPTLLVLAFLLLKRGLTYLTSIFGPFIVKRLQFQITVQLESLQHLGEGYLNLSLHGLFFYKARYQMWFWRVARKRIREVANRPWSVHSFLGKLKYYCLWWTNVLLSACNTYRLKLLIKELLHECPCFRVLTLERGILTCDLLALPKIHNQKLHDACANWTFCFILFHFLRG